MPKYPDVTVPMTTEDGNSMMIIGRVRKALRRNGVDNAELDNFSEQAMSGDYDNVLRTVMEWVETT